MQYLQSRFPEKNCCRHRKDSGYAGADCTIPKQPYQASGAIISKYKLSIIPTG
jgi:hypothetical protein